MTVVNILGWTWFGIVIGLFVLLEIYDHSSKDYSKRIIQCLEEIIQILYVSIPFVGLATIISGFIAYLCAK